MTICTKTKKVLLQTLSFTEPRKPALTLTGNLSPRSRGTPSKGTDSRSASPHLRVSRWRRLRALPIAGGGRDVGGPGRLPAAEVPRQLRPGAQQGGAEDQRLERSVRTPRRHFPSYLPVAAALINPIPAVITLAVWGLV